MKRRKNRKNKKPILAILCGLLALCAIIIVVVLFLGKGGLMLTPPEELLAEYMACIEKQEYETMFSYLDEASSFNTDKEEFITKHQNIYQGIEAANIEIEITDVLESKEDQIQVNYTTTMDTAAGSVTFPNSALFNLEETEGRKGYRLSWSTGLIFPDLSASDKVRVNTVKASRGSIYDRNGQLLAGAGTASSVGLVPGKMTDETDREYLAELLGITAESISSKLEASWVTDESFVPIKSVKKLNDEDELMEALVTIPGILITDTEVRSYPLGEEAAHLIGYVQNVTAEDLGADTEGVYDDNSTIGRTGLEKLYEERLRGTNGVEIIITDSEGSRKKEIASVPVADGEEIYLTIDADIQRLLYSQYREDQSASIVLNPKTGEVLAMVSTPTYDSNDFVLGMGTDTWNALNEDEALPLYNRFRATWAPGSSFKPVTAAIGVNTGLLDPDQNFGESTLRWQKDESWGSYHVTTLHTYNNTILRNAMIHSDNIYFAKAALQIGSDTLAEQLTALGFTESVPFPLGMSASTYTNGETINNEIQLADSGYGQGEILTNPLHLATIYTAFVNDGNILQPYLELDDSQKGNIWLSQAFTPETADIVLDTLKAVVEDPSGTGHRVYREGTALAGKTGTAEIKATQNDTTGTELGWFCVLTTDVPDDDALLILTMVENVKDRGGSGYVVSHTQEILGQILD